MLDAGEQRALVQQREDLALVALDQARSGVSSQ